MPRDPLQTPRVGPELRDALRRRGFLLDRAPEAEDLATPRVRVPQPLPDLSPPKITCGAPSASTAKTGCLRDSPKHFSIFDEDEEDEDFFPSPRVAPQACDDIPLHYEVISDIDVPDALNEWELIAKDFEEPHKKPPVEAGAIKESAGDSPEEGAFEPPSEAGAILESAVQSHLVLQEICIDSLRAAGILPPHRGRIPAPAH